MRLLIVLLAILLASPALALEAPVDQFGPDQFGPGQPGEVRVPLSQYQAMLNQLAHDPRPAPAAYAIGQADVAVSITDSDERNTASIAVTVLIETFEDEWTLVPILPSGAALRQATVDGRPVQLVQGPDGLSWSTAKAGTVTMQLHYGIDARRSAAGFVLPVPVPRAAATAFSLTYPGTGVDLAVVPAADLRSREQDGGTHFSASVPATSSILVSWRVPSLHPYAISRARYSGTLRGDALVWSAHYQVEVFESDSLTLPLMPSSVTLTDLSVDGQPATVLEQDGRFATRLRGQGLHDLRVEFQVPVTKTGGPPQARLLIPQIPVSRFDLVLPGQKEVKVLPGASVVTKERDGATEATVFIPMSESVVFTWTEAVPEDLHAQVRANASLYHIVHAEEGVLHGRATVAYEITRGETSVLAFDLPGDIQMNRIEAPDGGLSDWAVSEPDATGRKTVTVFLELPVSGEYLLNLSYERLFDAGRAGDEPFGVPLLVAKDVDRQRGMLALLSGQELTLKPAAEEGLTRVGENQLPAFIRNQIAMTVAHTYKYSGAAAKLSVSAVAPERRQGIFDAQVDTLISLGEVAMKGSATVEIDVKSGSIADLTLRLPGKTNVLGVSAPSLRSQQVREVDGQQSIALEFTREMEGQFRIEVNYERIMDAAAPDTAVPTISVGEAEVEHGRIAVEALTAVEVQATNTDELSSLDINELPQQLVLKTTNPILLAYRYVHAKPPFKLALKITRHKQIDVQVAAIERAHYSSLFTRDGLAVTTARLIVRNSRRQFLRLALPPRSQVWSVFVDGKPEKPAFAGDSTGSEGGGEEGGDGEGTAILVKMINSAEGFPVDIVYATPVQGVASLGSIASRLPRPDMVVTHTRWDVFLPVGPRYQTPDSSMDVIVKGVWANPRRSGAEAVARAADAYKAQMGQPLRINVPTQGIRFAFEKLYANQSREDAAFSIRYVSAGMNQAGLLLSALGTIALWVGIAAIGSRRIKLSRGGIMATLAVGAILLVATLGYAGTSPLVASVLALLIALLLGFWWLAEIWRSRRAAKAAV